MELIQELRITLKQIQQRLILRHNFAIHPPYRADKKNQMPIHNKSETSIFQQLFHAGIDKEFSITANRHFQVFAHCPQPELDRKYIELNESN